MRWDSSTSDEQNGISELVDGVEGTLFLEVYRFDNDGTHYMEFYEKHDALCNELDPERGTYSIHFDGATAASCEFSHDPAVCKCNRQLYHIGQDESIYRAQAREGKAWMILGV